MEAWMEACRRGIRPSSNDDPPWDLKQDEHIFSLTTAVFDKLVVREVTCPCPYSQRLFARPSTGVQVVNPLWVGGATLSQVEDCLGVLLTSGGKMSVWIGAASALMQLLYRFVVVKKV